MNGHPSEEELALFAGGDLSGVAESSTREHLRVCSSCRERLTYLENSRSWLHESAEAISIPERDFAEVRERVGQRLQERESQARWWHWVLVSAMCILALLFWWPPSRPHAFHQPPLLASVEPEIPAPQSVARISKVTAPRRALLRRNAAGLRSVALLTAPGQAPVLKITTADPNVVILLQTAERKDLNE